MKIVMSHPTGNANVRAIARGFVEAGMLSEFHTTIATFPGSFLDRLGKLSLFSELKRRRFDSSLEGYTKTYPWRELGRMAALKAQIKLLTYHETGPFCVDAVYKSVDRSVSQQLHNAERKGVEAVYAYEDGALETFIAAKKNGMLCVYDLPIAYWQTLRDLLIHEVERMPKWKKTLGGGIKDSPQKLERKSKELELADIIIGPAQFVMESLPQWAKLKKRIISPFGSPEIIFRSEEKAESIDKRPLRILFAGSMGQRKGLGDLFEAMKLLKSRNVELVVMGSLLESMEFYRKQFSHFIHEPGRPHHQVLELMRTCDVFCLPSIVEGRALVMQEAMSQGLPIVITPNTGGEDLVIEGTTGFLVPIRSPQKIAEKIDWFASNINMVKEMGKMAKQHAATYTWKKYAETIVNELSHFSNEKPFYLQHADAISR